MKDDEQHYEILPATGGGPRKARAAGRGLLLLALAAMLAAVVVIAGASLLRPGPVGTGPTGTVLPAPAATSQSVAAIPPPTDSTTSRPPPATLTAAGFATIPEGLVLPHENNPDWVGANIDLPTCSGADIATSSVRYATDIRHIQTGSVIVRTETLIIAPDSATGATMYHEIADAVSPCPSGDPDIPVPTGTLQHVDGKWQNAGIYTLQFPAESGPSGPVQYVLVAQSGRAVIVKSVAGEGVPAPRKAVADAGLITELQAFADALQPKLCVFYDDGCAYPVRAPNGQIQFPKGSLALPDGTVILPDGAIYSADGHLLTPAPPAPTHLVDDDPQQTP